MEGYPSSATSRKRKANGFVDVCSSAASNSLSSTQDLLRWKNPVGVVCLICLQEMRLPHDTPCGHTFCYSCIFESLKVQRFCPRCCYGPIEMNNVVPNNELFQVNPTKRYMTNAPPVDQMFSQILNSNLGEAEIDEMIKCLWRKREMLMTGESRLTNSLLDIFTKEMLRRKELQLAAVSKQCDVIKKDRELLLSKVSDHLTATVISNMTQSAKMQSIDLLSERLLKHFDGLQSYYIEMVSKIASKPESDKDLVSDSICFECEGCYRTDEDRIESFGKVCRGVAQYGTVKRLASLNYDVEIPPQQSIVSSLEFDKDGELFVVAGVTKRIKIFDYESVIKDPYAVHYPLGQLKCKSKISNVSWSQFNKELLCSSDYDGDVNVWDINTSQIVKTFHEHEKRCWTVHFNNVDPNLLASGSDDAKVKIWNLSCDRSVCNIDAKVNVCCVCFSPTNKFHLAFGSADHTVHMYDIRMPSNPLNVLKGHKKAVSYVRYLNEDQVVSAYTVKYFLPNFSYFLRSTDSTLRVWCAKTGRCIRILRGHINEKNFVGLSDNGNDHIMCGSENGSVFFYHKYMSDPVLASYVGKEDSVGDPEGFISSVCWKKNSDIVLVANSYGNVQFLQLS